MPVYTNFVCEFVKCREEANSTEKSCATLWPLNFDELEETWGSMLDFVKAQGWRIEGGPQQNTLKCWCPAHANSP